MVWSLIQNVENEADIIHTHRLFLGFYFKKQKGRESIMKQWVFQVAKVTGPGNLESLAWNATQYIGEDISGLAPRLPSWNTLFSLLGQMSENFPPEHDLSFFIGQ